MAAKTNSSDVTGWQKWETVKTPQGEVLYKDPNKPGWVYDPVLSANKGRNVFRRDPTLEITKTQEAEDAAKKQQDLQNQAMSPIGQLTPIAGTVGGTVLAGMALNGGLFGGAGTAAGAGAAAGAGTAAGVGSGVASGVGAGLAGAVPAAPIGISATSVPGAAAAAPGFIGSGAAGLAVPAAVAGATYLGGKAAYDMFRGREMDLPGRAILGVATGGISEVGKALGFWGGKNTTRTQQDRWGKLADQGAITPEVLAAKEADLSRSAKERSFDPIAGKKWDLQTAQDRVKQGGTAADEFGLVYGNFKTFGKDWDAYTPDQKRAIITANAQAGNYTSDKGDVLFKDEEKAKQIKDQVLSSVTAPVASNAPTSVQQMMRTNTRSPGIDKNGKRISY